jgi:hypothetical protein
MDPYLERPDRWSGVHAGLIAVIRELLTRQVAPRFFVDSEDNVYVLGLDDPARSLIRPDTYLVEAEHAGSPAHAAGRITAPTILAVPMDLEIRVPYLTIMDALDRHVVTTIEVLSPINKVQGSSGQRDFLRKREHVLRSSTHWLEIDLLRAGTRAPGIPSSGDYAAALHRAGVRDTLEARGTSTHLGRTPRCVVGFAGLRAHLPIIAVPLEPPFEDVGLDLQVAVETVYDRYRYDIGIAYDEDPPAPPMREADDAWVRERIAAWRQAQNT